MVNTVKVSSLLDDYLVKAGQVNDQKIGASAKRELLLSCAEVYLQALERVADEIHDEVGEYYDQSR